MKAATTIATLTGMLSGGAGDISMQTTAKSWGITEIYYIHCARTNILSVLSSVEGFVYGEYITEKTT